MNPIWMDDFKKTRILCFGDSLTYGSDPTSDRRLAARWPRVLQAILGDDYTVIEEGQGGRNIATDDPPEGEKNGLKYILPCLETHNPLHWVIVMLGTNDCKRKFAYSMQDISWNMERMLQKILTHRQFSSKIRYQVLLVAPPPMNIGLKHSWLGDVFEYEIGLRKSEQLAEWYEKLAAQYSCHFLNAGDYAKSSPADGVHLDEENQIALGRAIAEYVLNHREG